MATVNGIFSRVAGEDGDGSIRKVTWHLTTANDTGVAVKLPEHGDRTWHIKVNNAGGSTVEIQGANAGDTTTAGDASAPADGDFAPLNNAAGGTALTFNPSSLKCIASIEAPEYTRPKLTVAGTGADVVVTLIARRANPMRT